MRSLYILCVILCPSLLGIDSNMNILNYHNTCTVIAYIVNCLITHCDVQGNQKKSK